MTTPRCICHGMKYKCELYGPHHLGEIPSLLGCLLPRNRYIGTTVFVDQCTFDKTHIAICHKQHHILMLSCSTSNGIRLPIHPGINSQCSGLVVFWWYFTGSGEAVIWWLLSATMSVSMSVYWYVLPLVWFYPGDHILAWTMGVCDVTLFVTFRAASWKNVSLNIASCVVDWRWVNSGHSDTSVHSALTNRCVPLRASDLTIRGTWCLNH